MKWGILCNGNLGIFMSAPHGIPVRSFAALTVGLVAAVAGCAAPHQCYCRDAAPTAGAPSYTLACPDVLEITARPEADLTGRLTVGPDGTIPLGTDGRLRVEGLTADEVAGQLAAVLGVSSGLIQARVAEFASRQVFLCGPVAGHERAVPYHGPETVVDLLRRTGGLSRDAQPREVYVIRANVAAGRRPEVFSVDLEAIFIRHNDATNICLQPYDQVYVGETARSNWAKYLPQWLRVFSPRSMTGGIETLPFQKTAPGQ
jgi:protein involved in polysaccharide export with SLBB domain